MLSELTAILVIVLYSDLNVEVSHGMSEALSDLHKLQYLECACMVIAWSPRSLFIFPLLGEADIVAECEDNEISQVILVYIKLF